MSNEEEKKTVMCLDEFLEARGFNGDTPYCWARCFYEYTDCGPWVVFLLKDGTEAYYEDKTVNDVTNDNCIGLRVGSIVEGSDVCYGPEDFMFPFCMDEFHKMEEDMGAFTKFYWERDNYTWYVVYTDDEQWYCHSTWDGVEWDGEEPPEDIKNAAIDAIENHMDDIPTAQRWYYSWAKNPSNTWEPFKLSVDGAFIHEYVNDTDFY